MKIRFLPYFILGYVLMQYILFGISDLKRFDARKLSQISLFVLKFIAEMKNPPLLDLCFEDFNTIIARLC